MPQRLDLLKDMIKDGHLIIDDNFDVQPTPPTKGQLMEDIKSRGIGQVAKDYNIPVQDFSSMKMVSEAAQYIIDSIAKQKTTALSTESGHPSREDYEHEDYSQHYPSLHRETEKGKKSKRSNRAHKASMATDNHREEKLPTEETAAQFAVRASTDALAKATSLSKDKPLHPQRHAYAGKAHLRAAAYHKEAGEANAREGYNEAARLHMVAHRLHTKAAKYHSARSVET